MDIPIAKVYKTKEEEIIRKQKLEIRELRERLRNVVIILTNIYTPKNKRRI